MVSPALVEESPAIWDTLVVTSGPWAVAILGLEIASSVYFGLARAVVLGGCSVGLALVGVVWLGYCSVGLALAGAVVLGCCSVGLIGAGVEMLTKG